MSVESIVGNSGLRSLVEDFRSQLTQELPTIKDKISDLDEVLKKTHEDISQSSTYSSLEYEALEVFEFNFKFELEARIGNQKFSFQLEAQATYANYMKGQIDLESSSDRIVGASVQSLQTYLDEHFDKSLEENYNKFNELIDESVQAALEKTNKMIGPLDGNTNSILERVLNKLRDGLGKFLEESLETKETAKQTPHV